MAQPAYPLATALFQCIGQTSQTNICRDFSFQNIIQKLFSNTIFLDVIILESIDRNRAYDLMPSRHAICVLL